MSKEETGSTDESIAVLDDKNNDVVEFSQPSDAGENAINDDAMDDAENEKKPSQDEEINHEENNQDIGNEKELDDNQSLDDYQEPDNNENQENDSIGKLASEVGEFKIEETVEQAVEHSEETPDKKSFGIIFMFILIILVGAAGSAGAYYFWQQQTKQVDYMQKQATSMRQQAGTMKQQANDLMQQADEIRKQARLISSQQQSISSLKSDLNRTNSNFKNSTQLSSDNAIQIKGLDEKIKLAETVSQKAIDVVNRNQRDWALAEINYLLRMAHQRLSITKDVKSAIAALKGADERIEQLGDLVLFKVRKQLAIDIGELNAIQNTDINGMSLALDQAISSIKSLPFITVKEEMKGLLDGQEMSALDIEGDEIVIEEKTILQQIIDAVKKLGDIKVHQRSVKTADSVDEQSNIEQLLRMHLLAARLASLQYDQKQFMYELNQAEQLLDTHYDRSDNRIQQLQQMLKDYSTLQLNPDLPELTKAWMLLQTEMKKAKAITSEINAEQKKNEL